MIKFKSKSGLDNVIFITGSFRSGKTTTARILASSKNTVFFDEPLSLISLCILEHLKKIDREIAIEMFVAYATQIYFDAIIGRNLNFKKTDLSYIYKYINQKDLKIRMEKNFNSKSCS